MIPASELPRPEPAPKPAGGQFSLQKLFVAIAAISLVLALVVMTQRYLGSQEQLRQQTAELTRLRAEAGYLVVTKPTMVHVLAVPTREDNVWKWKVYLPPPGNWQLHAAAGMISPEGFANQGEVSWSVGSGDLTIEAYLQRDRTGDPKFCVTTAVGSHPQAIQNSASLEAEVAEELFSAQGKASRQSGQPIAVTDIGGSVELLRVRRGTKLVYKDETSARYDSDDSPTPGVLIWLEPVP